MRDRPWPRSIALLVGLLAISGCGAGQRESVRDRREILVFAAASLRDALAELAPRFESKSGIAISFNLAGSNVLARQIEASPRADVFISADEQWMEYLEKAGLIAQGSRRSFLSNRLVIIAHRDSPLALSRPAELATADFRFLSLGDPKAVPAGRYAKAYLESVPLEGGDLWESVQDRVAPAPNVRAALGLVEAEPEILGIVYRSDAAISDKVRILHEVVGEDAPPILYVAARIVDRPQPEAAERFLEFLEGREALTTFAAHGFVAPP